MKWGANLIPIQKLSPMRRCFTSPELSTPEPVTPSGQLSGPSTSSSLTSLEYSRTIQTHSYKELWNKIHHHHQSPTAGSESDGEEEFPPTPTPSPLVSVVLHPDPSSVAEALRSAPSSRLTSLASAYFEKSELASRLCLSLQRAVDRARLLYAPLHRLLDALPDAPPLCPSQCSVVFDALLAFHRHSNPFPIPPASDFEEIRAFFSGLRGEIDSLLRRARGRALLLRRVTRCSAVALVGATVGVAVVGVIIATHGVAVIAVVPAVLAAAVWGGPGDLLEGRRKKARCEARRLEEAMEGTYVGDYVETMRCVAALVEAKVESDRAVAEMGVRRGCVERHALEVVVGRLRRGRGELEGRLKELEQHVCICCNAVNRARSLLLRQILPKQQEQEDQHQRRRRRRRRKKRKLLSCLCV